MSNSEPSAIVFQGIACIRRIIHKVRFEWRDRFAHGSPQFTRRPIVCLSAPSAQILFSLSVKPRLCRRKISDSANRPSPKRLKVGDKFVSQWGCCIMHPESIGTCTVTVRRMSPSRSRPRSVAAGDFWPTPSTRSSSRETRTSRYLIAPGSCADVDSAGLLPELFRLKVGCFYAQLASEEDSSIPTSLTPLEAMAGGGAMGVHRRIEATWQDRGGRVVRPIFRTTCCF